MSEQVSLGAKIAENEKWLKEMAEFTKRVEAEREKLEKRCTSIMYQAHFAIFKDQIGFKIGARETDISFKLSDYPFFQDKTTLDIFGTKEGEDFVQWLNRSGLTHKVETVEPVEGEEGKAVEVISIIPA